MMMMMTRLLFLLFATWYWCASWTHELYGQQDYSF